LLACKGMKAYLITEQLPYGRGRDILHRRHHILLANSLEEAKQKVYIRANIKLTDIIMGKELSENKVIATLGYSEFDLKR